MTANQKKEDNSSYQFIQEKIVSSRRKKWKKFAIMVGTALALGLVFGVAAGAAFGLARSWLDSAAEDQTGETGEDPLTDGPDSETEDPGDTEQDPTDDMQQPDDGQDPNDGKTGNESTDGEDTSVDAPDQENQEQGTETGENDPDSEGNGEAATQITVIEQRIDATLQDYQSIYQEIGILAEEVNKSIVKVTSVTNGVDWFQNPYATEEETSGLVLATDEERIYLLVSYSHIQQAGEIRIDFYQGVSATATFLDADTDVNLAVVTVQKADLPRKLAREITAATLGESYSLRVGEPVMALGSPNGQQYSMLLGIVTSRDVYAYVPDGRLGLFHTDMRLAEGGEGVIVDMNGKVVGLITRTLGEDPELCTALSISRIQSLLDKLVTQTPRIYAGILGIDLSEKLSEQLQVPGGVYVTEVENGSPAALAGIRAGDVILQINEENVLSINGFAANIQKRTPQEVITLHICRMVRTEAVMQDHTLTLEQKEK